MVDGGERSRYIRHRYACGGRVVRLPRPLDHDNRQMELSGRFDLAVTCCATRVFRYHDLNAVFFQHTDFVLRCERTACSDVTRIRQLQRRFHGIDAADEIVVLGRGLKRKKLLSTERQKHASALAAKRDDRLIDALDTLPVIARLTLPGRTRKPDERNACSLRRLHGIGGNSGGIGMGRIHQNIEIPGADEIRQPRRTAEAATAHGYGLFHRGDRAARHGEQDTIAGIFAQPAGQEAGIGRAAKNEYGACHDL